MKSSENLWFTDDFRGNRSQSIRLNLINIRSGIWRRSLSDIISTKKPFNTKKYKKGKCMERVMA